MPTIRTYDANGNLTYDGRQDLEIRWKVLNLVSGAETHDDGSLTFSRLSDGTLVARQAVSGGSTIGKRYCGSFVFTTGTGITTPQVESVAWDEGRVFRDTIGYMKSNGEKRTDTSLERIINSAQKIYKDYPEFLEAIENFFRNL